MNPAPRTTGRRHLPVLLLAVIGTAAALLLGPALLGVAPAGSSGSHRPAVPPDAAVHGHATTTDVQRAAAGAVRRSARSGPWSDPGTWSGRVVPGSGDAVDVAAGTRVTYDVTSSEVAGVMVRSGAALVFDPDRSRTLSSTRNVVVDGTLVMRPSSFAVVATLRFVRVDESRFAGGGMVPLASDVGLWVMGHGVLDLVGAQRTGWQHVEGSLAAGARSATLQGTPTGWRAGDELLVTPTQSPAVGSASSEGFETRTVSGVSGRTVSWDAGLSRAHPRVAERWSAEVADLTRNVRLEGTASGHSHVFIASAAPQTVRYVAIRWMGARLPGADDGLPGRYGLHFHLAANGSRGSLVEGTVVRDGNNRAYVAHRSHGITYRDDVAYDVLDGGFWWDPSEGDVRFKADPNATDDTMVDHMLVARVDAEPSYRGYGLAGYTLGMGYRNTIRDSVAVGVLGAKNAAGFVWPEDAGVNLTGNGQWDFSRGNVAHNNRHNGIFVWQNTGTAHDIRDFAGFHNGEYGVLHGAYGNDYHYSRSWLYGNAAGAVQLDAQAADTQRGLVFDHVVLDGAGLTRHVVVSHEHEGAHGKAAPPPTVFRDCTFRGYSYSAFHFSLDENPERRMPERVDVVDPTYSGRSLLLDRDVLPPTRIRVQRGTRAYQVRRYDQPGVLVSGWQARWSTIDPFAVRGDVESPSVSLRSPLGGSRVSARVPVSVHVSDDRDVASVSYYLDGVRVATATEAPFAATLDLTGSSGRHILWARAEDTARRSTVSTWHTVTVAGGSGQRVAPLVHGSDAAAPTGSLLAPAPNEERVSGVFGLRAVAYDDRGLASVRVTYRGRTVATMTRPPYDAAWDTRGVANGSGDLVVRATDLTGRSTVLADHHLVVDN